MRQTMDKMALPCILTEEEKRAAVVEMAERIDARDTLEAELKTITKDKKDVIAEHEGRISELARRVRDGQVVRSVSCAIIYEETNGLKRWYRQDTGELVRTEKMELDEYQQKLPVDLDTKPAAHGHEAEDEPVPEGA